MDFGSGDGWTSMHEAVHEKKTQKQQILGDRLPFPVTIASLAQNVEDTEGGYLEVGDYHFTTLQTVGVIMEITNVDGNFKYLLHDPEDTEHTFHVITIGDSENKRAKFVDSNLEEDVRVRVLGKLKAVDGEKTLLAWVMQKLTDDKDYEIFKLEAEAANLFHKEKMVEKMRHGNTESWEGMLAPPTSRFSNILSPVTPSHTRKREETSPSTSFTSIVPKTPRISTPRAIRVVPAVPVAPPIIPNNPYIQNSANIQKNVNILINQTGPIASPSENSKNINALKSKIRACIRMEENLREYPDASGVSLTQIFQRVGNVPEQRIRAILKEMEDVGTIYTAAHDEFRTTENLNST